MNETNLLNEHHGIWRYFLRMFEYFWQHINTWNSVL